MSRGAIIGRFQPFHLGHLDLIKQTLLECNELVIIIGSAQFNYTIKNPFTAGERILMIQKTLTEYGVDMNRIFMIPFINDENNARWFSNIRSMIPPIDIFYSGNEFVLELLKKETIYFKKPILLRKNEYNGTYIRKLILKDDMIWNNLVSSSVIKIINELNGVNRIKIINQTINDSPSSEQGYTINKKF